MVPRGAAGEPQRRQHDRAADGRPAARLAAGRILRRRSDGRFCEQFSSLIIRSTLPASLRPESCLNGADYGTRITGQRLRRADRAPATFSTPDRHLAHVGDRLGGFAAPERFRFRRAGRPCRTWGRSSRTTRSGIFWVGSSSACSTGVNYWEALVESNSETGRVFVTASVDEQRVRV